MQSQPRKQPFLPPPIPSPTRRPLILFVSIETLRCLQRKVLDWEKESMHRPAPVQNFSSPKKWGPQRKILVVDMVFLVFIGFLVSTTDLESFSLRPEKFPKRFSFGGRVRFLLLCWRNNKSERFWKSGEYSHL